MRRTRRWDGWLALVAKHATWRTALLHLAHTTLRAKHRRLQFTDTLLLLLDQLHEFNVI